MCSICGEFHAGGADADLVSGMNDSMRHRGPDQRGSVTAGDIALGHNRLAVMDVERGLQPMTVTYNGRRYTIVYNGEIYNTEALCERLRREGIVRKTSCDTEVVLWYYALFGEDCPAYLNGIFAFAVYEEPTGRLFICRDRLGVKPFFYTYDGGVFRFASEIKALLTAHPARLGRRGLWELLYLAPVTVPGSGILEGVYELPPATCGYIDEQGLRLRRYWTLEAKPFRESREDAVAHTRELMLDAVRRQLTSDVPLCSFLSGGLDSSVVSAIAADACHRQGRSFSTYSFEYEGNRDYFHAGLFQPNTDDAYAAALARKLGTEHTVLTVPTDEVAALLGAAALYRDMPGQADIDSSLLWFCREVKHRHTVALSGECADEIFGGYPWFYRPEMLHRDFFPWLHEPHARISLFRPELVAPEEGYAYISEIYRGRLDSCPMLEEDGESMRTARIATCLSVDFFMTNLLARKDRMSMASGLEVRVPFADHRILEYVYNVPWEIKFEGQTEKALLRHAMEGWLPDEILWRKKSPYPKTYNPRYEQLVAQDLRRRLQDPAGRLRELILPAAVDSLMQGGDVTWFGQLMSRPQLLAWLCQFDEWLTAYQVDLTV